MENKHSQIRIGSNIRCLVASNYRNFDRDIYLTDAWLPDVNIWIGEYPYKGWCCKGNWGTYCLGSQWRRSHANPIK